MEGYVVSSPVLAATFAAIVVFFVSKVFLRKRLRFPPGPTGLPFFGNFLELAFSKLEPKEQSMEWAKKYGDVYMYSIFGTKFVALNEYSLAQKVYMEEDIHTRLPLPPFMKALDSSLSSPKGLGIIFIDDAEHWKELRGFVHNHLRNVKRNDLNFESLVTSQAEILTAKISEMAGSYFDPADYIFFTVANVTSDIVSNKTYEYGHEDMNVFLAGIWDLFRYFGEDYITYAVPILSLFPSSRKTSRKLQLAIEKMFDLISSDIDRYRESFKQEGEERSACLIEAFLNEQRSREKTGEDEQPFNEVHLKQVIMDLYMAGFETTSTSLSWYFLFMAQHPDVQAKVQSELDEVVGRNRMPNIGDRSATPFTQATLAENFRFSTFLPSPTPHLVKKDFTIGGYNIPEGSHITLNLAWMALSPDVWEDPMEFRPERFLDEEGNYSASNAAKLAQFGIGRRSCVGEQLARTELYIICSHILHRFTLRLPEGTPISLAAKSTLTVHPVPYKIQAIPRNY